MNIDDPRLTAFALNELDEPERSTIARMVATSPEAQRFVEETREITRGLKLEYGRQLDEEESLPGSLIDIRDDPWFWSIGRPLAIAAALAIFALVAGVVFFSSHQPATIISSLVSSSPKPATDQDSVVVAVEPSRTTPGDQTTQPGPNPYPNAAASAEPVGNSFFSVREKPRSTFSIYVGGSTYPTLRRLISQGIFPPKEVVRVEELINSFTYDYPPPTAGQPFSITGEVARCPWKIAHKLIRVGVQGSRVSGAESVARGVAVEVNFNPSRVAAYRLIGYERPLVTRDGLVDANVDAGEVGVGHSVTALYEIIPAESADEESISPESSLELITVRLRYREAKGDKRRSIEGRVVDTGVTFASSSNDFKFVAAVARFGLLLSGAESDGAGTLAAVMDWARQGKGTDASGERADFLDLVQKTETLKKG